MTGCLDQLSYWASFWWECFFTKMQRIVKFLEREFWNFLVKVFLPFFMVYLTEALSFGYSFFTSQVLKLFMSIKK